MVRVTTCISSPLIATACHTVCPGSPPCIGKRRPAVQEILRRQRVAELKRLGPERLNNYKRLFQNSRVLLIPKVKDRRASLQPQLLTDMAAASSVAMRRASLLPLNMMRRSSVRPGLVVPKVRLCKAPAPTHKPEKIRRTANHNELQIPKWDYKMKKIERKQEEERQRLLLTRRRWRQSSHNLNPECSFSFEIFALSLPEDTHVLWEGFFVMQCRSYRCTKMYTFSMLFALLARMLAIHFSLIAAFILRGQKENHDQTTEGTHFLHI